MQNPSSLPISYSLLPKWREGLQAEQADRPLISKMMVTKTSLSSPVSLCLSLSLQPHHVLHRYSPNHSLAKQWCTHHLPFHLGCLSSRPSVFLVAVYPAPLHFRTSPPTISSPSCGECERSKHELSPVQPKKPRVPSTCSEASVEREEWLADRWNLG